MDSGWSMDRKLEPDHVPEEWFELYLMNNLPEPQTAILETRLLVDEDCRRKLDETEAYIAAMRGALRRAQREPVVGRGHWWNGLALRWLAWPLPLATVSVLAGVGVLVFGTLLYRGDGLGPVTQTINLTAQRGLPSDAVAHPGHLQLRLDLRGISEHAGSTVQVVTELGGAVWSGPMRAEGDYATVDVRRRLEPGEYLVRINSGPDQLREFRLAVQ
jgi:hypothetical protein